MRFGIVVAAVAVICGLAVVGPVSLAGSPAQGAPPPPTPPVPPASSRASATLPVLPIDAQRAVEDYRRQQADVLQRAEAMIGPAREALMRQLEAMAVQMAEAGRGDDAVAVRAHIRLLQQEAAAAASAAAGPLPPPARVNMVGYRDRVGQSFTFEVTGSADLPVYGTGVYTDDTALESAAVHAGVLRSGQTGLVRVTILAGMAQYVGSRRNGIESLNFGPYPGSFRIEAGSANASRPTSIASFRGRIGETLTVPVVGSVGGTVWGSDTYTDDSSLAAAAVHAGIVQVGEFAFVRVTMVGGLSSYPGVSRNGVSSQPYGEWQGSFELARAPQPWVLRLPADVDDASGMISLPALRGHAGVSFSLQVVGTAGSVRGTDVYTDDSSIAAAAVHAGLLRMGEKGYVRVMILPGQQSYTASEQHGVRSAGAGPWQGSFRIGGGSGGGQVLHSSITTTAGVGSAGNGGNGVTSCISTSRHHGCRLDGGAAMVEAVVRTHSRVWRAACG